MHVMFDAIYPSEIPASAGWAAGYVNGRWPTFTNGSLQARLPNARLLSITVTAAADAECLDVETGDATPDQIPDWMERQFIRGATRPCVYANRWTMENHVATVMRNAGIPRVMYRLWVADYTGYAHIPPGYGACQWTSNALGRNLDESLCLPGFFNAVP